MLNGQCDFFSFPQTLCTQSKSSECGYEERAKDEWQQTKEYYRAAVAQCVWWGEQLTQAQQVAECLKVFIDVLMVQCHKNSKLDTFEFLDFFLCLFVVDIVFFLLNAAVIVADDDDDDVSCCVCYSIAADSINKMLNFPRARWLPSCLNSFLWRIKLNAVR